jgi:Protein of unknown function (DUF3667)
MENKPETKTCRNCLYSLPDNAIYCPQCSQKYTTGKIPVGELIKEFFSEQFNLDSRLFKTIYTLFVPGKLTIEYFEGKHKSFVSPLRTFLVTAIILFATIGFQTSDVDLEVDESNFASTAEKESAIENLDSINQVVAAKFNNPTVNSALDSVLLSFTNVEGGEPDSSTFGIFTNFRRNKSRRVAARDIAELGLDELADKYDVTVPFERFFLKQQIKTMKNGKGLFQYFLGKLTLMILLMMPFLAFFLKLLYFRRDFYYVEHLIFSFHYHAFIFLIITVLIIFGKYLGGWLALPIVGIFVYQFMAMKRVYTQSFFKTFLKFWILNFMYLILVIIFFSLTVLLSFVLF